MRQPKIKEKIFAFLCLSMLGGFLSVFSGVVEKKQVLSSQVKGDVVYSPVLLTSPQNVSLKLSIQAIKFENGRWLYQIDWDRTLKTKTGSLYVSQKIDSQIYALQHASAPAQGSKSFWLTPNARYRVEFYQMPEKAGVLLLRKFFNALPDPGQIQKPGCQNLWWFDDNQLSCGQKQFCGDYMYQGLKTFSSEAECLSNLPVITPTSTLGAFNVQINNKNPKGQPLIKFDTSGNAIDAHDGTIKFYNNQYYLYGTAYNCGAQFATKNSVFCGFKVYTSTDLMAWTDNGFLFDPGSFQALCANNGCYNPSVIYNKKNSEYVLWFSVTGDQSQNDSGNKVFTSASPNGPFVFKTNPKLFRMGSNGTAVPYVDEDGKAYVAYSWWGGGVEQFNEIIEQLDDNYYNGTGNKVELGKLFKNNGKLIADNPSDPNEPRNFKEMPYVFGEGGPMFKRNGHYYLIYNYPGCPYCNNGISRYIMTSNSTSPVDSRISGGWLDKGEQILSNGSCGGQNAGVLTKDDNFIFLGDVWNQVPNFDFIPDLTSGRMFKNQGRASFHWEPLVFKNDSSLKPLECSASIKTPLGITAGTVIANANLDANSGYSGFAGWCDIGQFGSIKRLQTFKPLRSGVLSAVSVNVFQSGNAGNALPDKDLKLDIVTVNSAGQPESTLKSFTLPRRTLADGYALAENKVGFSPNKLTVLPNINVQSGKEYGILLYADHLTKGCFGFTYNDSNVYPAGRELYSADDGATYVQEDGRAIKFEILVEQ